MQKSNNKKKVYKKDKQQKCDFTLKLPSRLETLVSEESKGLGRVNTTPGLYWWQMAKIKENRIVFKAAAGRSLQKNFFFFFRFPNLERKVSKFVSGSDAHQAGRAVDLSAVRAFQQLFL